MSSSSEWSILGQLMNASNSTLLVERDGVQWVYKPISGERDLWDFPDGHLAFRERAAYVMSELLGWNVVPLTELVEGPLGLGSAQQWVEGDVEAVNIFTPNDIPSGWINVFDGFDEHGTPVVLAHADTRDLQRIAVFDALVNNADRKAGHLISKTDGSVVGIDHGVTFHHEPKLRTVLWGWVDEPIEQDLLTDMQKMLPKVSGSELSELLTGTEIQALLQRGRQIITEGQFPQPNPNWPAVPWPVF